MLDICIDMVYEYTGEAIIDFKRSRVNLRGGRISWGILDNVFFIRGHETG